MTISETERYHGAALSRLIREADRQLTVGYRGASRSTYVVNGVGLYLKYSTKRLSPWSYTFTAEHQAELDKLETLSNSAFLVLVCGKDGIVCLGRSELQKLLDDTHLDSEWIRVSRQPREKYKVTGSDGRAPLLIADNEFPAKLFNSDSKSKYERNRLDSRYVLKAPN